MRISIVLIFFGSYSCNFLLLYGHLLCFFTDFYLDEIITLLLFFYLFSCKLPELCYELIYNILFRISINFKFNYILEPKTILLEKSTKYLEIISFIITALDYYVYLESVFFGITFLLVILLFLYSLIANELIEDKASFIVIAYPTLKASYYSIVFCTSLLIFINLGLFF